MTLDTLPPFVPGLALSERFFHSASSPCWRHTFPSCATRRVLAVLQVVRHGLLASPLCGGADADSTDILDELSMMRALTAVYDVNR